jgi:hypothetical protein
MRAAILLLAGGCSFAMTSSPEPHRPCPTSQPAPYIDAAAAVGLAVLSIALVVQSGRDYAESDTASIATLSGLGAGLFSLAATRGFTNVQACREHDQELAAEALAEQQRKAPRTHDAAWQVTKQAAASARAGDCAAVAGADRALRDLDAEFHATVFVRDVAIARCLQPITPRQAAAPTPAAPATSAPAAPAPAPGAPDPAASPPPSPPSPSPSPP